MYVDVRRLTLLCRRKKKKEKKTRNFLPNISLLSLHRFKSVNRQIFIFHSVSVDFISLCDLVIFVLCVFSFRKTENFLSLQRSFKTKRKKRI